MSLSVIFLPLKYAELDMSALSSVFDIFLNNLSLLHFHSIFSVLINKMCLL